MTSLDKTANTEIGEPTLGDNLRRYQFPNYDSESRIPVSVLLKCAADADALVASHTAREAECRVKAVALAALIEQRDQAIKERDSDRAQLAYIEPRHTRVCEERTQLLEQRDRMRLDLMMYGKHEDDCAAHRAFHRDHANDCICGFSAALASSGEQKP